MADIATLGIKVTTDGVQQASSNLDKLSKSSDTAAAAADRVDKTWQKATFSPQKLLTANESLKRYRQELDASAGASKRLADEAARNATALARENGVRDRLSALLATNRGQRILEAEAARRTAEGIGKTTAGYTAAGLSAKQLVAAQRQLPAQFTDIFTTLAAGQSPLQVFLQQGGQLKDVFGGVGPALRASAGYIAGLVNPLTITAAAVAGLGFAWKEQQDRLDDFNIALAKTNNFIGLTAEELVDLTEKIDRNSIATAGGVTEAVNRVVAGGRIAQEQLEGVSKSAAEVAAITGESIDSIVKKYEALSRDPVDTLLKLNESERFLTQEQLNRVRALEAEGRAQDAATEAIKIYMDNSDRMVSQVRANLGEVSRLWLEVKDAASQAWKMIGNVADAIAGVTRRQAEANTRLVAGLAASARNLSYPGAVGTAVGYARNIPNWFTGGNQAATDSRPRAVFMDEAAVDSVSLRAQIKAQEEYDRLRISNLSKAAKLEEEIADIRKKGLAAGKSEAEIQKTIADARARYKESLPKGPKGSTTDPSVSILQQLRTQIALNEEQSRSEKNLTESQRLRIRVTEQLETLGGKVSASRRAEIQAELQKLATTDAAVQKAKEQIQVESSLLRLREQIANAESARKQSNEIDLLGIRRGGDEVERQRRALEIEYKYQEEVRELYRQAAREKRSVSQQEEDELRESRDRMLADETAYYEERDRLQSDWRNGYQRALDDYVAYASDVASRAADAFNGITRTMEDALTEFFQTGKLDWKEFFSDISAQIARFYAQQIVKDFIEMLGGGTEGGMSSGSSGGGTDWGALIAKGIGMIFGGGRASGGPVQAGRLYEVGERGPELLQMGGRNFMIPGRDGYVQPNAGGRGNVALSQTFVVQGRLDRASRTQLAQEQGREASKAISRNS